MSGQAITVVGGGSWGTALAHVLASQGLAPYLWLRDATVAHAINTKRENIRYLPGLPLHTGMVATTDPAVLRADIVVLAIPCQKLRHWLAAHATRFRPGVVIVNLAKGLEQGTLCTCSQIVAQTLGAWTPQYAVLSGPSFAVEVLQGLPTAVVLAATEADLAHRLRDIFSGPTFRCYSSNDVVGVEWGGAVKNVMAIAAGICDGLGLGHNSRAALVTRGLAEMRRLGVARGAQPATFMGLSGLGDLVLTCTGDLSRNRQVGMRLGQGEALAAITASLGMVAEGVPTTQAVHAMAHALNVDAPLTDAVYAILYDHCPPAEVLRELLSRRLRDE